MRKQYHIRQSEVGPLAWDVDRLVEMTRDLTPVEIPVDSIKELDEPFWFGAEGDVATCRKVAEHANLIEETNLDYPIIVDPNDRVMDGMHRVCKAYMRSNTTILAYRLPELPKPDYEGNLPNELPYD